MKLGVFTCLLQNLPLEEALKYFKSLGIEMIELGCGGFPGNAHCDPETLLNDEEKFNEFVATIKKYDMEISALSCHGNPVHPDKEKAAAFDKTIRDTILLAEKLGLHQINTFSGCPGDCPESKHPNWVVCPWPDDFSEVLKWQWEEVLVPYWKDLVAFAKAHGVNKIALELHPGFCVYNTESLLKLREAVGPEIGQTLPRATSYGRVWIPSHVSVSSAMQYSISMQKIRRSTSTTQWSTACLIQSRIRTKSTVRGFSAA